MTEVIFQMVVGMGMIGMMWRLTSKVGELTSTMKHAVDRMEDHESRIRVLEKQP